jgi:hypothetical protein
MALDGGGGGGGGGPISSSNPTGTGGSINYIGNHAFANSGEISITNSETTMLEFTTQNSYVIGTVQFNMLVDTADDMFYKIKINNETVNGYLTQGAQQSTDSNNVIPILLPPFSKITMTATNAGSSTGRNNVCVVVGRVYA